MELDVGWIGIGFLFLKSPFQSRVRCFRGLSIVIPQMILRDLCIILLWSFKFLYLFVATDVESRQIFIIFVHNFDQLVSVLSVLWHAKSCDETVQAHQHVFSSTTSEYIFKTELYIKMVIIIMYYYGIKTIKTIVIWIYFVLLITVVSIINTGVVRIYENCEFYQEEFLNKVKKVLHYTGKVKKWNLLFF